ncbi:MAG: ABC transporter, partial [Alphaproteobacteria bacterium]|nr:ABC transporter [Alphaproteobacteria bacterium]
MTPLLGDTLDVRLGERLAVHGATLVLPPGQVLGIVGPNGA